MYNQPFRRTRSLFSALIYFVKGRRAFKLFQASRQKRHLEAAIENYRHACEALAVDDITCSSYLINYATAVNLYDQTFARTNRKAIDVLERACSNFEERNYQPKDYATILNKLGESYLNQYCGTRNVKDYHQAIAAFDKARDPGVSFPGSVPFITSLIGNAVALWTSCDLQPQFEDFRILQRAISDLETARTYNLKGKSTIIEAECCLHLGSIYCHLYDPSLDNLYYLDKSIECSKRAVDLFKTTTTSRAIALINLAGQQCRKHFDMENEADLVEAEKNIEKAGDLVRRGYGTRDLPREIEDLTRYIASCRRPVRGDGNEGAVGLGDKRVPCSMSRYYLRNS